LTLSVRLPNSLHPQLRDLAEREGVSMNQLISSAVGEKLASLLTLDYLRVRGLQGKRSAYDRVLRRVRDVAPEEQDALPAKTKVTKRGQLRITRAAGCPRSAWAVSGPGLARRRM
jgi:predicted DNA-binding ribbon-helix-helix protein